MRIKKNMSKKHSCIFILAMMLAITSCNKNSELSEIATSNIEPNTSIETSTSFISTTNSANSFIETSLTNIPTSNIEKQAISKNGKSNNYIVIDDIVYYTDRETGIYSISTQGYNLKKISNEVPWKIFVKDDEIIFATDNLYAIKTNGSNIRKIANLPTEIYDFQVYNDNIYYTIDNTSNYFERLDLYKVSLDGKNQKLILKGIENYCFDENNNLFYMEVVDKNREIPEDPYGNSYNFNIFNITTETQKTITSLLEEDELASGISDMFYSNGLIFFITSGHTDSNSFYCVKEDGGNLKLINYCVYKFIIYNNDYYVETYDLGIGRHQLYKYEKKDFLNSENLKENIEKYEIEYNIIDFQIFNNKLYTSKNNYWFISDLDGANKRILADFNSLNVPVDNDMFSYTFTYFNNYPILYVDDEYTYFLGGYIKNDSTKFCTINLETGEKEIYYSNKVVTEDWQSAYDKFLNSLIARYDVDFYPREVSLMDLNNDNIPELILLSSLDNSYYSEITKLNIYTFDKTKKQILEVEEVMNFDAKNSIFYIDSKNKNLYLSSNNNISHLQLKNNKLVKTEFLTEQKQVNQSDDGIKYFSYEYKKDGKDIDYDTFIKTIQIFDKLKLKDVWDCMYENKWIYDKNENYINTTEKPFYIDGSIGIVRQDDEFIYYTDKYGGALYSKHKTNNTTHKILQLDGEYEYISNFEIINKGIIFNKSKGKTYFIDKQGTKLEIVLEQECYIGNIKLEGDLIYYYLSDKNFEYKGLYRTNLLTKETTQILNQPVRDFVFYNDQIYFFEERKEEGFYIDSPSKPVTISKANKDGSNYERIKDIITSGTIYVDEKGIYYNDYDASKMGFPYLYLISHDGKNIKTLVKDNCSLVYFRDNVIYYSDYSNTLYKINKDGTNKILLVNNASIIDISVYNDYIYFLEFYNTLGNQYSYSYYRMKKEGSDKTLIAKY